MRSILLRMLLVVFCLIEKKKNGIESSWNVFEILIWKLLDMIWQNVQYFAYYLAYVNNTDLAKVNNTLTSDILSGLNPQLPKLLVLWLWANNLTWPSFNFLICEMGTIMITTSGSYKTIYELWVTEAIKWGKLGTMPGHRNSIL